MPIQSLSSLQSMSVLQAKKLSARLKQIHISAFHLLLALIGIVAIGIMGSIAAHQIGYPLSRLFGDSDSAALRVQIIEMQQRMGAIEIIKDRFATLANPLPSRFAPNQVLHNNLNPNTQGAISPSNSLAFAPLSTNEKATSNKELLKLALAFNESLAKAEQQWLAQIKVITQLPTGSPVAKNAGMSSDYGTRIDPFTHALAFHPGIDFAVAHGSPIMATGDGIISKVDVDRNNGQYLEIEHASGFSTRYSHVSSFAVRAGDTVKRGQIVAAVGNTGRSTGSHLHYEIRFQGVPINPLQALSASPQQLASSNQMRQ